MEPILFHFLRQQSTAACGNSSLLNWTIFFRQSFITASKNKFFLSMEIVLFYPEFFLLMETIIETWGMSVFKDKIYSCQWTSFLIFSAILRFFEVEANFPYSWNLLFNKSFTRLVETDFLSSWNSVFWSELIFCWWKPL